MPTFKNAQSKKYPKKLKMPKNTQISHTSSSFQLFSYPSSISTMSGVISPTNLSLYSSPVTTPRTTPRTRWNNPFLMEEDFGMMTHPVSSNHPDSVILMEEGERKKDFQWIFLFSVSKKKFVLRVFEKDK